MPHASIRRKACAKSDWLGVTVAALLALAPMAAGAAESWDDKLFNPKAADGDVVLPMPCGGAMAFRKVTVPGDSVYADYPVTVGAQDESHGFAEGAHTAHVAGSFSEGKSQRYFLMAKYEVSEAQFDAVMAGGECPAKPTMAKRLPKTEIAWIDAVTFADRYSQWLRKNAAAKLPKEEGELGYARLPTEVEWEFAARGGIKVSPAEFSERLFPMPEGMARYVWFAGTQSANGKPQLTGLLQPNPLGLHDMLGNVDEIVLEPFRLSRLDRLHGQVGAFVVRGGNYLTGEQDIRAAYRQEVPFYDADAPRRSKTTGFRVTVAAPVLTSAERLRTVQAGWSKLGAVSAPDNKPAAKAADDPLEELALLAKAAPDPATKTRLQNLQTSLRANIAARDEQRDRAAKASLRLGAFLGRKLSEDSRSVDTVAKLYKTRIDGGLADDPRTKSYKDELDREQAAMDGNLRYYADSLIRTAEDNSDDVLKRQKDILIVELQGMGLAELKPYVERYFAHLAAYQKDKKVARTQWLADWNKMQ
ncbi:MAG TPA: SUMF1/EgtB/PvdO family nonheme iron enzyme [Magnetospirillum sp.]|nr:SUMF1/EgtB/PvdO family nonheme iron enzyme [Magnetospirillum sp.]